MDLTQLIGNVPSAVISLALGALICFAGYRLRKAGIMLTGALLGFSVASDIAANFLDQSASLIVGVVAALVVAGFCSWLYDAGIFVFCGACGALFASSILSQAAMESWLRLVILAAVFIAVGALALKFVRPVMILATGLSGASSILSSLVQLGLAIPAGTIQLIALLVLAAVGIGVQFGTTRG
ncbi:MAG TPA: TMEM198/TM7SF3 family protein [Candidatus Gemmiger faecigallinarum]|nr:TMEM198/TM7SF3 family protein [Candidatus Gemmiger faecigallinarum]